jgi:hypothetical protein
VGESNSNEFEVLIEAGPDRGQRVAAGIVAGIAFIVAIAGLWASTAENAGGNLATPIVLHLPPWLGWTAAAALSLASLLFLVMLMPWRRPRKKGDDELEIYHEPQPLPFSLVVVFFLIAIAPLLLLAGIALYFDNRDFVANTGSAALLGTASPPTAPVHVPAQAAHPASFVTAGLIVTLAVLVGFGSLAFVLWLRFGDRWLQKTPADFRDLGSGLGAVVAVALDDLEAEDDPRRAILKIYRNFERAVAAAAVTRRPWQTPVEFMRAVLERMRLPAASVSRLTQLFEVARFSEHPMGAAEREGAWQALLDIRAHLPLSATATEDKDGTTA